MRLIFFLGLMAQCVWFAAGLIGCCEDVEEPVTAALLSVEPWVGGAVIPRTEIRLSFDRDPGRLRASAGTVGGSGTNRFVTADAELITLSWDNGGSATLTYTLVTPDPTGPWLINSTPARGAQNVDPASVNASGIVLEFDKDVRKPSLQVQVDGHSIGPWTATTNRGTVVLTPAAGAQLVNDTAYLVIGIVEDAAGSQTEVRLRFATAETTTRTGALSGLPSNGV